jgi:hypothetical protein
MDDNRHSRNTIPDMLAAIEKEYLETALSWIDNGAVADYMAKHHHDKNANELWE